MIKIGEVQCRGAGTGARWHALTLAFGTCLLVAGCGDDTGGDDVDTPQPEVVTLFPDAEPLPGETECKVVITKKILIGEVTHFAPCTPLEYPTNPPSGGDHWEIWASYRKYTIPVPRPLYVHNQEHGAVVLSYNCTDDCPEVVEMLGQVMDGITSDALCNTTLPPVTSRMLMAPDPELATPIAASAWGATYTATCIDMESLTTFVSDVYGKGTEETCWDGRNIEGSGAPLCEG